MSSFIGRFFKGIKEYFKPEFRYYTITFFFFVVLIAILAPIFLILDIKALNNIELVLIVGSSSALIYFVYMFLTMSSKLHKFFFQTKWKYLLGILVPFVGTLGLCLLIFKLTEVIPTQLLYIVTYSLYIAFFIWLVVQLLAFGLFIKDVNEYLLEKIEKKPEKAKRRLILCSVLFELAIISYLFLVRRGFTDVQNLIKTNLIQIPFDLWLLPLVITILSGVLLGISLIRKKYHTAFFTTGYILIYSLYLFYHIAYFLFLIYAPQAWYIGAISVLTLLFFTVSVIYTLQAVSGTIKARSERWWQPVSFFLFGIVLLYVTWSITFFYNLATAGVYGPLLEEIFWAVNHFISYIFGVFLLVITVLVFTGKIKRKKEVE